MSDRQLVELFLRERNEQAFGKLYNAKTPRLFQMALRSSAFDTDAAQDLVQEMWCVAIRKLDFFRWDAELKTWLTAILLNLYREKRKKEEREVEMREKYIEEGESAVAVCQFSKEDLEAAITKLPAGYRQVIILLLNYGSFKSGVLANHPEIARRIERHCTSL